LSSNSNAEDKAEIRRLKDYYEEYWLRRHRKGNLYDEKWVSPRYPVVLSAVGTNKDTLDVVCGEGFLSKLLKVQGNRVIGIDISEEAVMLSPQNGIEAYVCDIENEELSFVKKFDVIVVSEFLEHVVFPKNVLKKLKKYLKSGGFLVITFPNIAFYRYRWQLLLGSFPRQGLCEKSEHLHYWALPDFLEFLNSCGFKYDQVIPILSYPLHRILSRLPLCVKVIGMFPNLFGRQFVIKAHPQRNAMQKIETCCQITPGSMDDKLCCPFQFEATTNYLDIFYSNVTL